MESRPEPLEVDRDAPQRGAARGPLVRRGQQRAAAPVPPGDG